MIDTPQAFQTEYVQRLSSKIGSILEALYQHRGRRPEALDFQDLERRAGPDGESMHAEIAGALIILRGLGLVEVDGTGQVRGITREACFALGSLSKFLLADVTATDEPTNGIERNYLVNLTKALETMRTESLSVDQEPLHRRRIVNVLIKGRQIRHWRLQSVYLHVYHNQWRQYHLVGLSHKDSSKEDEEIAKLALAQQVGLEDDQYELDAAFNPAEVTFTQISATSGALTEYTVKLMSIKKLRVRLELRKLMHEKKLDQQSFRWFTWEEIQRHASEHGEPIMPSTPEVMKGLDLDSIAAVALRSDDVRRPVSVSQELSSRFTKTQVAGLTVILLLLGSLQFIPGIGALLNQDNPMLDKLAHVAQILSFLIPSGIALAAFASVLRRS
jgi:hypothetical protein